MVSTGAPTAAPCAGRHEKQMRMQLLQLIGNPSESRDVTATYGLHRGSNSRTLRRETREADEDAVVAVDRKSQRKSRRDSNVWSPQGLQQPHLAQGDTRSR